MLSPRSSRSAASRYSRRSSLAGQERRLATGLVSPALLVLALVAAYPVAYAVWLSLHEYSVRVPGLSRWAGLDNYAQALGDSGFVAALGNTLLFTVSSVTLELVLGLGFALVLARAARGAAALRAIVLVPWSILTVVSAITWQTLFDPELGFVNATLRTLGLPGAGTVWLGQEGTAMAVVVLADVWKTTPFMALLLLAGLQQIPRDVHDAAAIDGASSWQRLRAITLPLLVPTIIVALIFRTLDALRVFDLPYILTRGAYGTETLSTITQRELTENRLIGLGSAMSVLTFLVVMTVSLLYIRAAGRRLRALGAPA